MRARGVALLCCTIGLFASMPYGHAQGEPAQKRAFLQITEEKPLPNGVELHDGALILRITALRDDVLRIRAGNGALPEDASWAVLAEARSSTASMTQDSTADDAGFHTDKLRVRVHRATGLVTLLDASGRILRQDAAPLQFDDGVHLATIIPEDEHYFGLGDKAGALDRRDQAFRMWNTDAYGWQESTDPLYKSIPFYLSYRAGNSLGILMDETWPSSFDFGKTQRDTFQYRAEGAAGLDMYILYGPSAKEVLAEYAWLTGPTPLPPLWALGFQQSRYSYMTQGRVEEVAARLRADRIPADAIYLDIDYQQGNRPFTIDTKAFPDMPAMIADLHRKNFHVVAITDLHIANLPDQHYQPFDSGVAGDHFVKNADGSIFSGPVWPGPSVFPDFTQADTRKWWGMLYKDFDRMGVDGFWNDMNEPSVFDKHKTMPDSVLHRIEEPGFVTRTTTHREIHNVYGMENSRATFEGQLALRPDVRPFVLTRASYAGGQRYAATWTGDNSATWNHLRLTTPMLKSLGLSGFSLAGADVGGYAGTPTPELLTKWLEIAAFQPIDRDHAEKGTGDHEVWANGPGQEAIRRRFIETRYKLLPYLYTTMEAGTHTGLPLLRPVFLEFPDATPDRHPIDIDIDAAGEFMLGRDLLIAGAAFPEKLDDYEVHLPPGGWYDFWTGESVAASSKTVSAPGLQPEAASGLALPVVHVHPELNSLPVYVRAGAILPIAPPMQSTVEKPSGPLTLRIFPGPNCEGELYQDDGVSFAYKRGDFLRMQFSCEAKGDQLLVHIGAHQGQYAAWWSRIVLEINGVGRLNDMTINGKLARLIPQKSGQPSIVSIADDGHGAEVVLR